MFVSLGRKGDQTSERGKIGQGSVKFVSVKSHIRKLCSKRGKIDRAGKGVFSQVTAGFRGGRSKEYMEVNSVMEARSAQGIVLFGSSFPEMELSSSR